MTDPTDKSADELSDRILDLVSRYSSNIAAVRAVEEYLRKMGGEAWSLFHADSRLLAIESRPATEAAALVCRAALSAVRASEQVGDDAEPRWEDEGGMVR